MAYINHMVGPMKFLDNLPGAAVIVSQIEGQTFGLGNEKVVKSSGGQIYRTFTALMGQMPKFSGTTEAIAQFITALGIEGKVLATGVELYNQLVDVATGKRASGSAHEKLAFVKCLVVPRTLSCSHKGIAKITFDIFGVSSDGIVHPCTLSSGVALPAIVGVTEQFTLGPIKINGTTYEGIQDLTIDFGLSEVLKSGGADIYTTLAYLAEIKPKITIKTDDDTILSALTLLGTASSSTTVLYLCKCNRNAVRVLNATAEHISFTVYDGLWLADDKGGSHPGAMVTSIECEPTFDNTHAPIVVSAATAIS